MQEDPLKITLPLFVDLPRKTKEDKRIYLNLNIYRNLNKFLENSVKKEVHKHIAEMNIQHQFFDPVVLTYTYFAPDNRKRDLCNMVSIIDKYTCDALVSEMVLPEDNTSKIKGVLVWYGGVDKENPRCELIIRSLTEEEKEIEKGKQECLELYT